MHLHTPFLPALRPTLAPMGGRLARTVRQVGAYTLCQLESALGRWVPTSLFPKAPAKENSRDHHYTRWRSFWCLLWQALNPDASGREVVRQLQALFELQDGPALSEEDGAYCRAKARLPLAEFPKALSAAAQAADRLAPPMTLLRGRALKAVDGSAVTLSDTPKNRKAYPPLQCADRPSFPMMRIAVLFSVLSGAIAAVASGSLASSELALFSSLSQQLIGGDILLGDRGFGCYPLIAWVKLSLGVDFIGRTTRRVDGRRRVRRLARNDWLIVWQRSATPSPWLSSLQWAGLPKEMTLRAIKGRCYVKGFRVRQLTLVTTLLDPQLYPAPEILQAYLRRWRLGMCLDDLKTTLKLDFVRARSPRMAQKEILMRLIAHNLIRCTAAQAAAEHGVALERISFKGSVDALRHFSSAMAQARSKKKRQQLWAQLLHTLAADLVPERPDRREPRAIKRKKNKYPRLDTPRRQFRDHPKRNLRRKRARLRRLGLM
ncbi:MAG: IS4 family transposase [Limisphaerales bacterium]